MPARHWIALLAFGALFVTVDYMYGEIGLTRLVGGALLWWALWNSWAPKIPFYLGECKVADFTGWKKAWILVPVAMAGGAMLAFAPELASTY